MAAGAMVAALLVVVMVIVISPLIAPETIATFIAPPAQRRSPTKSGTP
jgi:hypothetical protein